MPEVTESSDLTPIDVVVSMTESPLGLFDLSHGEAEKNSALLDLPKATIQARPEDTLRTVLSRACSALGVTIKLDVLEGTNEARRVEGVPEITGPVDMLAFAPFHRQDDDEWVGENYPQRKRWARLGESGVIATRNLQGEVTWRRPPFAATMSELLDAHDAGILDGNPLEPYLVLAIPQAGPELLIHWQSFLEAIQLLREITGGLAEVGGMLAAADQLRKLVRRRSGKSVEILNGNGPGWNARGARPGDLIQMLALKPRRLDEVGALLGCSEREAEAILWALGFAASDTDSARWVFACDPASQQIYNDLLLGATLFGYPTTKDMSEFKELAEKRLREFAGSGSSPNFEEEKKRIHQEWLEEEGLA